MGQMALSPSVSSFACKFCHYPPLCVADCLRQIYYVVHRLPTITKETIHLGIHKYPMADGKCKEFVDKARRLIVKQVNCTPDAKISMISLGDNETSLAMHLLDDNGDGTMELMNGEQLE